MGLEGGLDSVQSELTSVRTDKEEVARNVQALEEQVEDLKVRSILCITAVEQVEMHSPLTNLSGLSTEGR